MPKRIVERGKIRGHEAFREKLDVKLRKTLELIHCGLDHILKRTTEVTGYSGWVRLGSKGRLLSRSMRKN
ncbi:hypothetical protein J6590_081003 [Homalodisca vitripennis]|nr:hypothetical protein J6590_081003 [Homalodisca vitripennis]